MNGMLARSLWGCAVVVLACGGKKAPTEGGVITITSPMAEMVGATVIVDGQRQQLTSGGASDPAYAVFRVAALPPDVPNVAAEISTPCGSMPVEIRVDIASRSPPQLKLRMTVTSKTNAVRYYIDAAPITEVKIGASLVKPPTGEIEWLDCGAPLDVSVGGTVVGQVDGKQSQPIFITSSKDACYRMAKLSFGKVPVDSPPVTLRGASVHRLAEPLRFFLEPPPESVSAPVWSQGVFLTELQKIACP